MRLLLVEDEPDLGAAIKRTLTQEGYLVDWVTDGSQAWDYLDNQWTQYTIAVIDWLLPQVSGLELCQRLRQQASSLPVLMLTAKDRLEDKVAGLDAGADDYLVKPFSMEELLARLRALQRRPPQFQPRRLQVGPITLDYDRLLAEVDQGSGSIQALTLTVKEFHLLEYLMQHPNQIMARDQMLSQLWELDAEPVSNVVAVQMRRLRRKLAQCGQASLIETVYGLGYRLRVEHEH